MSEALSGDLPPSEGNPKGNGPPLLRLGTRGKEPSLIAAVDGEIAELQINGRFPNVALTKRGAVHLAAWLTEWARPRSKVKLVGPAEIVAKYKVSPRTLANWRKHPTFPKPLAELAQGPVWERDAVRTWVKLDRPGRGRPRNRRKK